MAAGPSRPNDLISAAHQAAERARRERKKSDEREELERFLAYSDLRATNIQARERPDFLVDFRGGLRVGIEVQRLQDPLLSKTHAEIKGVVRSVTDELSKAQIILDVKLLWIDSFTGFADNPKRINLVRTAVVN